MVEGCHDLAAGYSEIVTFVTLSALIVHIWDLIASLADEVEYIWKGSLSLIKAIYFVERYVLLANQFVNQALTFYLDNGGFFQCQKILVYRVMVSVIAAALTEMVLIIRVYALYNRSFKVKVLLLSVFLVTSIMKAVGAGYLIHSFITGKDCRVCIELDKKGMNIVTIGMILPHCLVFIMTTAKSVQTELGRSTRTPLTSLILREGTWGSSTVIIATITVAGFSYLSDAYPIQFAYAMYPWFLTITSVATSRLVLNMRKLVTKHSFVHDELQALEFGEDR